MSPGLFGFGVTVAIDRERGWLTLKRALPMPPGAYLAAKLAMAMLFAVIIFSILACSPTSFGGVRLPASSWLLLLVVEVLGVLPFCAIGMFIGSVVSAQAAPAVANLIYLPMAFLSGLWMPLMFLPAFLRAIAPCGLRITSVSSRSARSGRPQVSRPCHTWLRWQRSRSCSSHWRGVGLRGRERVELQTGQSTRSARYAFATWNKSMTPIATRLEHLRARLLPAYVDEQGWAPLWNLFYLGFLFMNWVGDAAPHWLPVTLLSIAIFLPRVFPRVRTVRRSRDRARSSDRGARIRTGTVQHLREHVSDLRRRGAPVQWSCAAVE